MAGTPLAMIAGQYDGLLRFEGAHAWVCRTLVVILRHISSFRAIVRRLKINRVMCGELLFELCGKLPLFDVVIETLPIVAAIQSFDRVGRVPERAVLRAILVPASAALIFRDGA